MLRLHCSSPSAARLRWHGRRSGARRCTRHSNMRCPLDCTVHRDRHNQSEARCFVIFLINVCGTTEAVPRLEFSWQFRVLLPHQEIGDVLQQTPEQRLSAFVQLTLQQTLILHKNITPQIRNDWFTSRSLCESHDEFPASCVPSSKNKTGNIRKYLSS